MMTAAQLQRRIRHRKQAVLIVNTRSRKGRYLFRQAEQLLGQYGFNISETHAIRHPKHLPSIISSVLAHGPDLIIVGGGDGTVRTAASRLAYKEVALGYIPLGTTNNFARDLNIPFDIKGAIEVIAHGKVSTIDLGKANNDYFANVASVGISVAIAVKATTNIKRYFGRWAYTLEGIRALFYHRPFYADVKHDGQVTCFQTHEIVIANGRFHGGTLIAEDIRIDDHSLVIFHLGDKSRLQLLRSLLLFGLKRRRSLRDANFIVIDQATLTTRPPQRLELDGELKDMTPVKVSVAKGALNVLVPNDFSG